MKKSILSIGLFSMAILLLTACSNKRSSKPTILVFSKTAAFHHDAIPTGVKALQDLGAKTALPAARYSRKQVNPDQVVFPPL